MPKPHCGPCYGTDCLACANVRRWEAGLPVIPLHATENKYLD